MDIEPRTVAEEPSDLREQDRGGDANGDYSVPVARRQMAFTHAVVRAHKG